MFSITTLITYILSMTFMIVYTFTVDLGHLWLVFVAAGMLGFFMTGYLPIGFEFGAELTFPTAEGTQSGMLNCSAQVFGVIMVQSMGEVMTRVGVKTCNICVCALLFVGTLLTALIKPDLRRQHASVRKRTHEPAVPVVALSTTTDRLLEHSIVEDVSSPPHTQRTIVTNRS